MGIRRADPIRRAIAPLLGYRNHIAVDFDRNSVEALDHTPNGRIDVDVSAAEVQEIDVVEIVVSDNGPGFQSNTLGQIFDPYVTTKPKGTGLGLAIVKRITLHHDGSVEAKNRINGGLTVTIRLPAADLQ